MSTFKRRNQKSWGLGKVRREGFSLTTYGNRQRAAKIRRDDKQRDHQINRSRLKREVFKNTEKFV